VIVAYVYLGFFIHSGFWRFVSALVVGIPSAVFIGQLVNRVAAQKHMLAAAKDFDILGTMPGHTILTSAPFATRNRTQSTFPPSIADINNVLANSFVFAPSVRHFSINSMCPALAA
jgi:hypothetical protein